MKKNTQNPLKNRSLNDLILHEGSDYVVINKPPFVSTLADRSNPHNILDLARILFPNAKVCHRLDKHTSGILIIAKEEAGYKYFSGLFEEREVTKLYHAVVPGKHNYNELEVDKPIYTTSNKSRIDFHGGKPSLTLLSTLEIYKQHTLLACMPFTGRMHQIRVHLADMDIPIVGDHKYGGKDIFLSQLKRNYSLGRGKEEKPMIQRLALHAAGISFPDQDGETVKIKAPYPKDFSVLLNQLEKNRF